MGKKVVLTGGTSGIGKAIAHKIIEELGADLEKFIINYGHNDEAAQQLLSEIPDQARSRVVLVKADLSSYAGAEALLEGINRELSSIDWFISNTGIGTYEKFENYSYELWDKIIRTNVSVPAFLIQGVKEKMAEDGRIVLMGSLAGEIPYSSSLVYGVSKAAVNFMSSALMKEFEDKRVSVNTIAPGFIETPWQEGRSQESYQRINNKIALHRFGFPEEVAAACYHILNNPYINGSVIKVDGGYGYF